MNLEQDIPFILWFIFLVFVALMFLPRVAVMWFLIVVGAGMLLYRAPQITS